MSLSKLIRICPSFRLPILFFLIEFRVYQNQFFRILSLSKFIRICPSFKLPILLLKLNFEFIRTYQVLIILILKKKQWCKAIGSTTTTLSAVVFIFMVQSYNSMLMVQNFNFVFQIFLNLKKKQWCNTVGSLIPALSAIVSICLKRMLPFKLCLPEAFCMILPVLKLLLFWHRYFVLLIFADIVFCCFRLHTLVYI